MSPTSRCCRCVAIRLTFHHFVVLLTGKEAAKFVTSQFIRPINLEFEKVYSPYLLMNKKRYAGLLWTNPNKYDKLDAKGIVVCRSAPEPLSR